VPSSSGGARPTLRQLRRPGLGGRTRRRKGRMQGRLNFWWSCVTARTALATQLLLPGTGLGGRCCAVTKSSEASQGPDTHITASGTGALILTARWCTLLGPMARRQAARLEAPGLAALPPPRPPPAVLSRAGAAAGHAVGLPPPHPVGAAPMVRRPCIPAPPSLPSWSGKPHPQANGGFRRSSCASIRSSRFRAVGRSAWSTGRPSAHGT
jgi:hypothetical protein